jgi:hypothetical protein
MRRGLLKWDAPELPLAVLEARIARLRAAMMSAGLDAFVVYTNIARPAAVTWLTGFTPYWSESLLLVPREGQLAFATAMTNRVADWIRSNNPVSDVVSTPKPGALLGERLAKDAAVRRVGVLEFDALPSELADHLAAAAPAIEWIDGSALFASLRLRIDDAERQLIARADAFSIAALAQTSASDAGTLSGLIEKHARLAGAEEVYIAVAPDLAADRRLARISQPVRLADRFAVRASVAYKGSWVRRVRTFAKDGSAARADAWFADAASSLQAGKPIAAQLSDRLVRLPGAELKGWMVEGCAGSYPLSALASSRTPESGAVMDGQFLVLTVELLMDGAPWIGAAPLIVGKPAL